MGYTPSLPYLRKQIPLQNELVRFEYQPLPLDISKELSSQHPAKSSSYLGFRRNVKNGLKVMQSVDDMRLMNIDTKLDNQQNGGASQPNLISRPIHPVHLPERHIKDNL